MIQRLKELALDELGAQDVARVLRVDRTTASLLIRGGRIEGREHNVRLGAKKVYRVTREALLVHLLESTTGNKQVLLMSINAAFPESPIAAAWRKANAEREAARADGRAETLPVAVKRKARSAESHPDQGDLFATV
ncbi:MAG: hypothetical protein U0984_07610 [Prosthecobacter sp.]|nr:hypothetical protein [Prosthecobacter sp.]